jgi:hypothetical protein
MNYKLIAQDNNYPRYGGIAALIGIYPTEEGAEFIKGIVASKYPHSDLIILKTSHSITVKYPENFSVEKLNKK